MLRPLLREPIWSSGVSWKNGKYFLGEFMGDAVSQGLKRGEIVHCRQADQAGEKVWPSRNFKGLRKWKINEI